MTAGHSEKQSGRLQHLRVFEQPFRQDAAPACEKVFFFTFLQINGVTVIKDVVHQIETEVVDRNPDDDQRKVQQVYRDTLRPRHHTTQKRRKNTGQNKVKTKCAPPGEKDRYGLCLFPTGLADRQMFCPDSHGLPSPLYSSFKLSVNREPVCGSFLV